MMIATINKVRCWVAIALLLIIALAGCEADSNDDNLWKAGAALAVAEAETELEREQREPGMTTRKDTRAARERDRRILYFGASYCPACRVAEESLARLTAAGWRVGPAPTNHIQTFSIDAPNMRSRDLARKLRVDRVPTWILWENGVELERVVGVLDPFAVGKLFKKDDTP